MNNEQPLRQSPRYIAFPYQAVVFTPHGQFGLSDIETWLSSCLEGRYYWLIEGDHEYQFETTNGVDEIWSTAWPIVFRDAEALMMFKLAWGGKQ